MSLQNAKATVAGIVCFLYHGREDRQKGKGPAINIHFYLMLWYHCIQLFKKNHVKFHLHKNIQADCIMEFYFQ